VADAHAAPGKLSVIDEVANGLSYFDTTFLRRTAATVPGIEDQLGKPRPGLGTSTCPAFLQVGSWIGGDRDGNPFVTAEVLART
jgi:phosphoenolpyruvate carboxylase